MYSMSLRVVAFSLAIFCGFIAIAYPEWIHQLGYNYGYVPTVTTTEITPTTVSSAQSGGNVISDGGLEILAKGVCWSTSPNPTTIGNATMDGQGLGSFNSSLAGLNPGTTYYVRAYAINSATTGYGSDLAFKTSYASTTYVNTDESCGGETPCYPSIQTAIEMASTGGVIKIGQGTFIEAITLNENKSLTLQGGWDSSYSTQTSNSTFIKAPKAPRGSLTLQMVTIKP